MGPDPELNLTQMEAAARSCGAFGTDLVFDAVQWIIADAKATVSREAHALWFTELPGGEEAENEAKLRAPFAPAYSNFVKSLVRLLEHKEHHGPPTYDRIMRAARCLYEPLQQRGVSSPAELTTSDFEDAEWTEGYSDHTRYCLSFDLYTIAHVCNVYRLTWDEIEYEPSVPAPTQETSANSQDASLPSPAVFSALARIDSEARSLSDVAMMSVVKVIQWTTLRGIEGLQLGIHCERFFVDGRETSAAEYDAADPGLRKYGLSFYDVKNKRYDHKAIISEVVPIVRDAIATAKILSAPAREIARHYESGAGAWLPAPLRDRELMPVEDLAEPLWKSRQQMTDWLGRHEVPVLEEAVARVDLEEGLARTPAGWSRTRQLHSAAADFIRNHPGPYFTCAELSAALPVTELRRWLRKMGVAVRPRCIASSDLKRVVAEMHRPGRGLPQPLSETLFLFPEHFFATARQTFMPVVRPITIDQLRVWMRGSKYAHSVFRRYDSREANGDPIVVLPHAFRRWLITIVGSGRISLAQLREWTGHVSITAVKGYVRETEAEIAEKVMHAFRATNVERMPEHWQT
ncbi:hypothetical protein QA649_37470 [Bradyrhizobium sp. CB1717]|uniref:hypothetical protein n=1 Tax=Bradyrhizobium sp. CB1717 TaxID=3039154 RepID=UPI0024B04548|nr:hypothetical protein [Bradyrhizobium sp. CB1717]WFU23643.1 hypothetical protein QA649_37470 [Bradyrhizobium sp. CB1717]